MNTTAIIASPVDRVAGWFRRPASVPTSADTIRRAKLDAIEQFLCDHDLGLTPDTLSFALAWTGDGDPRLCAAANALRTKPAISARDIERVMSDLAQADPAVTLLNTLTRELEHKVDECIGAIGESFLSTSEYSTALNVAATDVSSSPSSTYHRLIALTLEVAETTREISRRLEDAHDDACRLRADLDRALQVAQEDDLTGLLNRRGFMQKVETAIADQPDRFRTLALCDIDDFKRVNDRHGHETGDRVLRYVAEQLREHLDEKVTLARYGGEEFVCLFEDVVPATAAAMLDGARDALGKRVLRDQESGEAIGSITFSAGLACVGNDPAHALRAADTALYAAKHQGKNRVVMAPATATGN